MLPRSVNCHDCGQIASVRGYGRIEYDWPKSTPPGSETTTPTINYVRLTIDCPCCGVKPQDFYPNGSVAAQSSREFQCDRSLKVPFAKLGIPNRRQFGTR